MRFSSDITDAITLFNIIYCISFWFQSGGLHAATTPIAKLLFLVPRAYARAAMRVCLRSNAAHCYCLAQPFPCRSLLVYMYQGFHNPHRIPCDRRAVCRVQRTFVQLYSCRGSSRPKATLVQWNGSKNPSSLITRSNKTIGCGRNLYWRQERFLFVGSHVW